MDRELQPAKWVALVPEVLTSRAEALSCHLLSLPSFPPVSRFPDNRLNSCNFANLQASSQDDLASEKVVRLRLKSLRQIPTVFPN